jgi:uncharacterized membrane protein
MEFSQTDLSRNMSCALIKTYILNLVHTTRFWNNLHQVRQNLSKLDVYEFFLPSLVCKIPSGNRLLSQICLWRHEYTV